MTISVEKAKTYRDLIVKISKEISIEKLDKTIMSELTQVAKEEKFIPLQKFEKSISKYFSAIYTNISSNSKVIYHDTRPNITIGKYGLGIKDNKQAKPIKIFSHIKYAMLLKEKIIKGLKNNGLHKKAEEFESFINIIRDYTKLNIGYRRNSTIEIPLKNKTLIVSDNTRSSIINSHEITNILVDINPYHTEEYISIHSPLSNRDRLDMDDYSMNYDPLTKLNVIIIMEQIEDIKNHFREGITQITKIQKEILEKLEEEFGKYIMFIKL